MKGYLMLAMLMAATLLEASEVEVTVKARAGQPKHRIICDCIKPTVLSRKPCPDPRFALSPCSGDRGTFCCRVDVAKKILGIEFYWNE